MRIKRAIILVLSVLVLIIIAGCKNSTPESSVKTPIPEQRQEANWKTGEITDPIELEKLWQEYLYHAITTVCNTREFNSAKEIDPYNVVKFCYFKYINAHGKENLALVSKDSLLRLFPLDTVLEYAQRYFNLTDLDVSKIPDTFYDQQKRAFILNLGRKRKSPSYTDRNAWGIQLARATRNSDGTITAVMVKYDTYQTRRVELTKTITLRQREDRSLYFVRGRWNYKNNHLVTLTGNYNRFDKITGFDGNMKELVMVGEIDKKLILAYTPYAKGKTTSIMLVNPDTLTVEKKLDLNDNFRQSDVKVIGDKIVVCLNNKIMILNKTLEQSEKIFLPNAITSKINRAPKYDKNGISDVYFGGYDISSDLTKIAYSDERGVKLFNTVDNSEKLLAKTVKIIGNKVFNRSYHYSPKFIANDKKVITTMTGYDSNTGYTICDLKKGTSITLDTCWGGNSSDNIRYDTGLLNVNAYIYDKKQTSESIKTLYFDFKTGTVSKINLEDTGETGFIRNFDYCFVGQNYAAFITYTRDDNDYANSMFYINRLDLKTLVVESNIISVKAAGTHILGVLADGRIVFWYNLNPSENGVCITK